MSMLSDLASLSWSARYQKMWSLLRDQQLLDPRFASLAREELPLAALLMCRVAPCDRLLFSDIRSCALITACAALNKVEGAAHLIDSDQERLALHAKELHLHSCKGHVEFWHGAIDPSPPPCYRRSQAAPSSSLECELVKEILASQLIKVKEAPLVQWIDPLDHRAIRFLLHEGALLFPDHELQPLLTLCPDLFFLHHITLSLNDQERIYSWFHAWKEAGFIAYTLPKLQHLEQCQQLMEPLSALSSSRSSSCWIFLGRVEVQSWPGLDRLPPLP